MADTTARTVNPPLKFIDNGDGTCSMAVVALSPTMGADSSFREVLPALKATDNGDGTYLLTVGEEY